MTNDNENDNPYVELAQRVARLEESMSWVKETLGKIDRRMWWVLGSVVVLGVIAVLASLYG